MTKKRLKGFFQAQGYQEKQPNTWQKGKLCGIVFNKSLIMCQETEPEKYMLIMMYRIHDIFRISKRGDGVFVEVFGNDNKLKNWIFGFLDCEKLYGAWGN